MHAYKTLLAAAISSALLVACGSDSSSDSDKDEVASQVEVLTTSNLDRAVTMPDAQNVDVAAATIPADLPELAITGSERAIVTANSRNRIALSVPEYAIPAGKKVGGYLVEFGDSSQYFVAAGQHVETQTMAAPTVTRKEGQFTSPNKQMPVAQAMQIIPTVAVAETQVQVAGWSTTEFDLPSSIPDLAIRIYPLLVNDTVVEVSGIEDIDLINPDNWLGLQTLELLVEAVATSPVQVSLTWNSEVDLDLWVVEPGGEKIYFADQISEESLGWLDYDNVRGYGPENITYAFQVPAGDYKIVVDYFSGSARTDYDVVVAVGGNVTTYSGSFAADADSSDEPTQDVVTISSSDMNPLLAEPIALNQWQGVWSAGEGGATVFDITEDSLRLIEVDTCSRFNVRTNGYFPTGFRIVNGQLQVSNAFVNATINSSSGTGVDFTYQYVDLEQSSISEQCSFLQ
ncbi:hypothetical protein CHH28_16265 [Bacterioplanes sanyensis]|uniref:Peptidase C-terminal archaeal/bacterial domain-containing protein n=1 Tax=Bacterioplanes sanyensis TaxID=1249553 RepID=A0A222FPH5_9GAMM|nr:hypothetical protein [Bacterioplanes sanyensis]ASP40133.1 hypothetical protein CHH28_16265 [Bacterioplanes sanyensis]